MMIRFIGNAARGGTSTMRDFEVAVEKEYARELQNCSEDD
jgi:hypothetical protein